MDPADRIAARTLFLSYPMLCLLIGIFQKHPNIIIQAHWQMTPSVLLCQNHSFLNSENKNVKITLHILSKVLHNVLNLLDFLSPLIEYF